MSSTYTPLVTIGIPTYNRAGSYLPEALESALSQTYKRIEVVVSDNGSTDHTEVYLRGHKDPRLRYFRQAPSLIPNDNFNFCLEQAKGDYFLLLHDDDMIDADFVETCIRAIADRHPVGIIRTGMRIINEDGVVYREKPNYAVGQNDREFLDTWLEGRALTFLCNSLFNTEYLRKIGGFRSKTNLYQDVVAEMELGFKYGRVEIKEIKATFRRHSGSMGDNSATLRWIEDSYYLLDKICEFVPELDEDFRRKCKYHLCMWNYSRVLTMKSIGQRLYGYYVNYRAFDYVCPPFDWIYKTEIRKRINSRRIQRGFRKLLRFPRAV
jgi:glycosyltransferase involved in cell wall biosynthesis